MKKHSKLSLGAFWAVVMIFAAVQFVSAAVVSGPLTIKGTITSMIGDGLVIDSGEDGTIIVYGMGPASYWAKGEVAFPRVGDDVEIVAYVMEKEDAERYVAASIENSTQDTMIILRKEVYDSDGILHLIPLWSNSKNLTTTVTTVLSDTAADCSCDCDCDCLEKSTCTCDCLDNSTCDCICDRICDCTCDCLDCSGEPKQQRNGRSQ
jgi:hypothetical protein